MILKKLMLFCLEKRAILDNSALYSKNINTILIRPLGNAIGDAVVHTAHIKQLKNSYPNAKIGVIVTSENKIIFEHSKLVDVYVYRNVFDYIKNYKKWDLLIDFENNFNSASLIMDRVLNPKYIAIFRKYNKKYYNLDTVKNYNFYYPQMDSERLSHYLLNSGFNYQQQLHLEYSCLHTLPHFDEKFSVMWESSKFRLLICPYGSKRYIPVNEMAHLLNQVISTELAKKLQIIISYTESALKYSDELATLCPNLQIQVSPKTSLSEYLSVIKSADFVIAVDGGSLHIACAFQKPLLSFFAKSMPNMGTWEPLLSATTPHLKVLTRKDVGTNSNLTKDFDLSFAIKWLNQYLEENIV